MLGVYIHFPFCERKCNYCAFSSFVDNTREDEYIAHLLKEIDDFTFSHSDLNKVDTIYFGGGTPSVVKLENIKLVLDKLKERFVLSQDAEITIECNPNSVTKEKLEFYKKQGINRISFGVQSFNDDELKFLGRLHSSLQAEEVIKLAKNVGFNNISCDLIIGTKGQTEQSLSQSIQKLIDLKVQHISSYMLQVEENTPLFEMVKKSPNLLVDDDECVKLYDMLVKKLEKAGYNQYEVSNFAQNGKESKHNFKYWTGENYIGFGLGASSYINRTRWTNESTFDGYFSGKKSVQEKIDREKLIEEHIMLGLRCENGVSKGYLKSLGYDLDNNENVKYLIKNNVLIEKEGKLYLDKKYYSVNNYIIVKLLP